MIKLEQKEIPLLQQNKYRICLSPFCFNSKSRVFTTEQQQVPGLYLHNKQQCTKWVINIFELSQPITPYKLKQFSNLELNFNEEPIQVLRKIARLQKSDWKKQISKEISTIKKDIISALDTMEENVLKKVEDILSKRRFLEQINGVVDKFISKSSSLKKTGNKYTQIVHFDNHLEPQNLQALTQELNKYFFTNGQALSQIRSAQFLKKVQLKEELTLIKKNIQDLEKQILEQKNGIKARAQQRVQFYEWIFQKQENMFNKLQMIGSHLNIKPQNFHIQGQTIRLNCMLCQKYVIEKVNPMHQKQLKKFMIQQLLIHLYNAHHDKIFYSYLKKVSKSECKQLQVSDILQKLEKIDQLHIIDRETGMSYTEDFISSDIEPIDILTKKNQHLAKNNYILIESKEAINSFVSVLAYQCTHQKKRLLVVSNRFQHLEEISKLFGFSNVTTTKKYDGIQAIKFEEDKTKSQTKIDPTTKKSAL